MINIKDLNKNYKYDLTIGQNTAITNLMGNLQDAAEEKQFLEIQEFIDNVDVNDWDGTSLTTILVVTHWYGHKLNRESVFNKVRKYYIEVLGYSEKKTDNSLKGLKGSWTPTFGFERNLFGISE